MNGGLISLDFINLSETLCWYMSNTYRCLHIVNDVMLAGNLVYSLSLLACVPSRLRLANIRALFVRNKTEYYIPFRC